MGQGERGGRIVVGIDGSAGSRAAMAWALEEAGYRDAAIEAVYAWQWPALAYGSPGFVPPMPSHDEIDADGQVVLDQVLADLPRATEIKVHLRVCDGPPAPALSLIAGELDVTTVVVGSRGHGVVAGLLLGSVSHTLTHHCLKPLVIVHPFATATVGSAPHSRVVVGVDGSETADTALRWAASEARLRGAALQVVVAWSDSGVIFPIEFPLGGSPPTSLHSAAQAIVERCVDALDSPDLVIERSVVEGRPAPVLIDLAASADLLVVGRRGLGRAQETIHGSVSHVCAHRSPVPVAIVPHSA
jgi:nucleotide-binding universal stress UspA family protein